MMTLDLKGCTKVRLNQLIPCSALVSASASTSLRARNTIASRWNTGTRAERIRYSVRQDR